MARNKRLILGLGNPGPAYEATRHNVGFWVVDAVADRIGVDLGPSRAPAEVAWGRWRGREVGLAKPTTYMNRSGEAVRALTRLYGLTMDDIVVVMDDINLPLGVLRLRQGGSAGGHNGIQDIIDHMGTAAFGRIRIGIGNDFRRGRQADYVLSPFSEEDQSAIEATILQAADAALAVATAGMTRAMNQYNRRPQPPPADPTPSADTPTDAGANQPDDTGAGMPDDTMA